MRGTCLWSTWLPCAQGAVPCARGTHFIFVEPGEHNMRRALRTRGSRPSGREYFLGTRAVPCTRGACAPRP